MSMRRVIARAAALPLAALLLGGAQAGVTPPAPDFGPRLERFTYPWPVQRLGVTILGEAAEMAYMDVKPSGRANGGTVVLLHGKNFCGATWEASVRALAAAGYRVIVPDQIGFCKSSKPRAAQYSLAMLATLTRQLLTARGIQRADVVGHSMGGMLAIRFALLYPQSVGRLVLVNPIGLVDRAAEGVPYTSVDQLLAEERRTGYASIKSYQLANYYHGSWRPAYDRWVWMLAGMYQGAGRETVALAAAKTGEMIYTQPVAYELGRIAVPTTLVIGTLDKTAFGRSHAPETLQAFLKAIPAVAPGAAARIPGARLVRLDGLGHAPQVEDPERFNATLLSALTTPAGAGATPKP